MRMRFSSRWMADNLRLIRLTGRPLNRRARVSRKMPLRFTRRVKLYSSELPGSPSFFLTSMAMVINKVYSAGTTGVSGTTAAGTAPAAGAAFFFIFTGIFEPARTPSFTKKLWTVMVGRAPRRNQWDILSLLIVAAFVNVLYDPKSSTGGPAIFDRFSATTSR